MKVTRRCNTCAQIIEFEVTPEQWKRWNNGALVQSAFPHLDPGQREILLSGTCGSCFDKLLGVGRGWPPIKRTY